MKFTIKVIKELATPVEGQKIYYDDELKGFGVRVCKSGIKSYVVEKRVAGKTVRLALGRTNVMSLEQAREVARATLARIATHIVLGQEIELAGRSNRKKESLQSNVISEVIQITLATAFDDFLQLKKLKDTTVTNYKMNFGFLACWHNAFLTDIKPEMVLKIHGEMTNERGKAQANQCMRFLRALYGVAMYRYHDANNERILRENPVNILTSLRVWNKVSPRSSYIRKGDLQAWYKAVLYASEGVSVNAFVVRDYLLFLLFTGLRKNEARLLAWDSIDFKNKLITVPVTKNGHPHVLPMSDFMESLLIKRFEERGESQFVFASYIGGNPVADFKRIISRIERDSGVSFKLHDLRRTFVTMADSLDISGYAVKRLVNHSMSGDVTNGYIGNSVERLREPMQRITDAFKLAIGIGA